MEREKVCHIYLEMTHTHRHYKTGNVAILGLLDSSAKNTVIIQEDDSYITQTFTKVKQQAAAKSYGKTEDRIWFC